jgi:Flp pilus assembly protein TadD
VVCYAALPDKGKLPRRAILLLLLACYGAIAIIQNTYWRDDKALFTRALEIDPRSSFAHVNLAGAYAEAGDMAAAERGYTEALRYDPDCAICYANIAQVRYGRGERKEAVAFYREAIRCGYRDSNILHAFAVGLMEIGEVEQGIKTFEQIAVLEPESPVALANVGQAYLVGGESRRAIEWLERAVALDSENAERHFLLGVAYEQADLGENAIIHYRIALQIQPNYRQASESLKRLEKSDYSPP